MQDPFGRSVPPPKEPLTFDEIQRNHDLHLLAQKAQLDIDTAKERRRKELRKQAKRSSSPETFTSVLGLFNFSVDEKWASKIPSGASVRFPGKTQSFAVLTMALKRYVNNQAKGKTELIKLSYQEIIEGLLDPEICHRKPNSLGLVTRKRILQNLAKNIRAKLDLRKDEVFVQGNEEFCFIVFQRPLRK